MLSSQRCFSISSPAARLTSSSCSVVRASCFSLSPVRSAATVAWVAVSDESSAETPSDRERRDECSDWSEARWSSASAREWIAPTSLRLRACAWSDTSASCSRSEVIRWVVGESGAWVLGGSGGREDDEEAARCGSADGWCDAPADGW